MIRSLKDASTLRRSFLWVVIWGWTLASPVADAQGSKSPVDHRRSAAWHDTLASTLEGNGVSGVFTYVKDRFTYVDLYVLSKLLVQVDGDRHGVDRKGRRVEAAQARSVVVEDFPGGVRARYELGRVKITTEILPIFVGRDTDEQDGAALYTIDADPSVPLVVDCGGGGVENITTGACPTNEPTMDAAADNVTVEGSLAVIQGPAHPFAVAVSPGPAPSSVERNEKGGQWARVRLQSGKGSLLVGYAMSPERARKIAASDPTAARKEVEAYYQKLLESRVRTPVKAIDDAFRSALLTLEYNWCTPFGWNESINHWHALWHMQHTAGAEWIGQADRSRACTLTQAENLMHDGAVPHVMQYVHKRRDFGGTNQFWAWQVRHYWQFTADRSFAERIAPALDRVIAQSYAENDPDGNRLLGWGLQIGNQEDYVATPHDGTTPSIEGINMYRARRELALGLDDAATARRCDGIVREIEARLRELLWRKDLGRFAFYRDPLGAPRLDGQYHSLAYPVMWEIADPLESWSLLRHLRDRLTGTGGEVYCSNNFPNHVAATVGTQAGCAQQPWAAWALAAAGLRNEAWRSLAAAAAWVMDGNHRGSWPEVSTEPRPAYFSPPAGLFVAATVEALFGLKVNKPRGRILVSPSFPDSWAEASLELPEYECKYRRDGHAIEFLVRSREPLARCLRWSLAPCNIRDVTVDGERVEHRLDPGVGCVFLVLETRPLRESRFRVCLEPLNCRILAPASIAEGDLLDVEATGIAIQRLEDPAGVLGEVDVAAGMDRRERSRLRARVRTGLLGPYLPYGRLGLLNFSRRSLFLDSRGQGGVRFWMPVDLAILPRYEAAPLGDLCLESGGVAIGIQIRNNTMVQLSGTGWLDVARSRIPLDIDAGPRSECEVKVHIPASLVALLSPGDNRAVLMLPTAKGYESGAKDGGGAIELTLNATQLFESQDALRRYLRARLRPIELPEADLAADVQWTTLRPFRAYPHMPWAGSRPPLESLGERGELTVADLGGVTFRVAPRKFVPVSFASGRPSWTLSLGGRLLKKLFILATPFLDNHDMFAPVAQITVETTAGGVSSRTLHFPGDLDWWSPQEVVGEFATAQKARSGRFGLLPLLASDRGDWAEGKPPAFPQPEYWATCLAARLPSAVLSVVEVDLGRTKPLKSVAVSTIGAQPGLGIVAIVGETAGGMEALEGTPWMPPPDLREPRTLFAFSQPGDLLGWMTEGAAFGVAPVPRLFGFATLNSLARSGEAATGRAISPEFTLLDGEAWLEAEIHGGRAEMVQGRHSLALRVVDAMSGEVIREVLPSGSHVTEWSLIPVEGLQGRKLRLELVDEDKNSAYAWIGLREVRCTHSKVGK